MHSALRAKDKPPGLVGGWLSWRMKPELSFEDVGREHSRQRELSMLGQEDAF